MKTYMNFMIGKNIIFYWQYVAYKFEIRNLVENLLKLSRIQGKLFELVERKGIYLYDYMDSVEKFD